MAFSTWTALATVAAILAFCAQSAHCQAEKRLSSAQQQQQHQQQQQQYYDESDVIKSKIRPDSYSLQDPSPPSSSQHGKQSDAIGSASTVYGEQYGDHQPAQLDEVAEESIISTGSINNHRLPQVIEGKNVGNRPVGNNANNYHHAVGNRQVATAAAGYAVDSSAYGGDNGPHYAAQDLIQDQNYQLDFKYHDYDKMTKFLRTTSSRFPNLTALYSIGKSVQGNN